MRQKHSVSRLHIAMESMEKKAIRSFKDLEVYQESFKLAMNIFRLTQGFPREELYCLTTQMRNASRSVSANIAEGWTKRRHELIFKRQLLDAMGSVNEMVVWLDTALDCSYITAEQHGSLSTAYEVLGRRLHQLDMTWKTFR